MSISRVTQDSRFLDYLGVLCVCEGKASVTTQGTYSLMNIHINPQIQYYAYNVLMLTTNAFLFFPGQFVYRIHNERVTDQTRSGTYVCMYVFTLIYVACTYVHIGDCLTISSL